MRTNIKQTKRFPNILTNNQGSFEDKLKLINKKLNLFAK